MENYQERQLLNILEGIKGELQEINNSLKPQTRHFKVDMFTPLKTTVEIKNKEDFLEKIQKLKNLFDEINTIIPELELEIELK